MADPSQRVYTVKRRTTMTILAVTSVGLLLCNIAASPKMHWHMHGLAPTSLDVLQQQQQLVDHAKAEDYHRELILPGMSLGFDKMHDIVMGMRYETDEPSIGPSIAVTPSPTPRRRMMMKRRPRQNKNNKKPNKFNAQNKRMKRRTDAPPNPAPTRRPRPTSSPTWVYDYMRGPEEPSFSGFGIGNGLDTSSPTQAPSNPPTDEPSLLPSAYPSVGIRKNRTKTRNRRNMMRKKNKTTIRNRNNKRSPTGDRRRSDFLRMDSILFTTEEPTFRSQTAAPTYISVDLGLSNAAPVRKRRRNSPTSEPTGSPTFVPTLLDVPTAAPVRKRVRRPNQNMMMRRTSSPTIVPTNAPTTDLNIEPTVAPTYKFDTMEGRRPAPVKRRRRMRRRRRKTAAPTRRKTRRNDPTTDIISEPTSLPTFSYEQQVGPSLAPVKRSRSRAPSASPTWYTYSDFWPTPTPVARQWTDAPIVDLRENDRNRNRGPRGE